MTVSRRLERRNDTGMIRWRIFDPRLNQCEQRDVDGSISARIDVIDPLEEAAPRTATALPIPHARRAINAWLQRCPHVDESSIREYPCGQRLGSPGRTRDEDSIRRIDVEVPDQDRS